jgi:3-methyl-2-oxobutanoate hydroxymethyltransferase
MDEMIYHCRAVARGVQAGSGRAMIVGDLPFMSYQCAEAEALRNAGRLLKEGGAEAVKLEGGAEYAGLVQKLARIGIPVMGHIGLTPQSATMLGGFRAQGRTAEKAEQLLEDALALERAGCFALVLEAVPAPVAARITRALKIPTIGIGAGAGCDGQVLVYHDLLGLYQGRAPRFVKRYAELAPEIRSALETYAAEVRSGAFPEERHTYSMPEEELEAFEAALEEAHEHSEHR